MNDQITIRNARHRDYKSICKMFAECNEEHCRMRPDLYRHVDTIIPQIQYHIAIAARNIFGYEPVSLQVAEIDKHLVGAVFVQSIPRSALSWSVFEKEAYLDNIVVTKEFRRQGVATKLFNAAKDWAKKTGHRHMSAKILEDNIASLTGAKQAGFTVNSRNIGMDL